MATPRPKETEENNSRQDAKHVLSEVEGGAEESRFRLRLRLNKWFDLETPVSCKQ
jgi:hypothetical protein